MRNTNELIALFGIDEQDIDTEQLLLSLTHSTTINEENRNSYLYKKIEYYYEIGSVIYNLLLKIYIYDHIGKKPAAIMKGHTSSQAHFIDKFIDRTKITQCFYINKEVLNQKIKYIITYQFLGFLYEEGYFKNIRNYFQSEIFEKDEIQLEKDYMSFIQEHSQARKIPFIFKELEETGPSHNKTFKYMLTYNGKSIIEEGSTKKIAKRNCCKLYHEKYLKHETIKVDTVRNVGQKRYIPTRDTKLKLESLANKLNLTYEETQICFIHPSISNEYDVRDNSATIAIGSDVERLYLILKYYSNYMSKLESLDLNSADFVRYIQGQPYKYKEYFENQNLDYLIKTSNNVNRESEKFESIYADSFKAILFTLFYKFNSIDPIKKLDGLYESILSEADFRYSNPLQTITTKLDRLGLQSNYTVLPTEEFGTHICKLNIQISSLNYEFKDKGLSKVKAKESTSLLALNWINTFVNPFLLGEKRSDYDIALLENLIEFEISKNSNKFCNLIFKQSYFGMSEHLEDKELDLIVKLSNTLEVIINFDNQLYDKFVSLLTKSSNVFMKTFKKYNLLIEAVILDLSKFIQAKKSIPAKDKYVIEERWVELQNLNKELLTNYISGNWHLIKYVDNPSFDLQLLAAKTNPNAIYFLENPSFEVLKYLLENSDIPINKESTVLKKVKNAHPDLLIDYLLKQYQSHLKESGDADIQPIIRTDDFSFDIHLKSLFKLTAVKKFHVAAGFVFSSGLGLLEEEINDLLSNDGKVKVIAGNLQKYNTGIEMKNMDIKTANTLNMLMGQGLNVKTFDDQFYHGKLYYLESDMLKILIMGSTNLSLQAFQKNKEVDSIYFFRKYVKNQFTEIFDKYWKEAVEVPVLDITRFSDMFGSKESHDQTMNNTISVKDMEKRIESIPDEILRKRLTLWLEYLPSNIFEDINVAKQDYIIIEYNDRNMVILESFNYGNSYFVFYDISIEQVLELIEGKTKSEIFKLSGMEKRGYHAREMMQLEVSIKSYFIG